MSFDVAVAGAGVVGLSFACGVSGVSIALLARGRPKATHDNGPFDARVYAISPGNVAFLERLNVWQRMPERARTAILGMRIYGDDGRSLLSFDAYDAGVPALAWIVEDLLLQQALWESIGSRPGLEVFEPVEWEQLGIGKEDARLRLRDRREVAARLVVGADGFRSLIREQAGIGVREHAYGQTAVVANFACARPHRNFAYQWFLGGPVLALLPLPDNHVSMVWATGNAEAARLIALDAGQLAAETAQTARGALGELSTVGRAAGFPLRRLKSDRLVASRVALLGDSAHAIHPLAGQGMNLGLQDARSLCSVLAERESGRDAGDERLLRRYERARAEQNALMDWTVHGLFSLFSMRGPVLRGMRNTGLNLSERLPVLKAMLMRQAMS